MMLLRLKEKQHGEVLDKLGLGENVSAWKRFCKVTRFHLELADTSGYKVIRFKHISRHGSLLIPPSTLTSLCTLSHSSLQELQLQNCPYIDFPLLAAIVE